MESFMDDQSLNPMSNEIPETHMKNNINKKHNLELTLSSIKKEITDIELRGRAAIENIKKNSEIEMKEIKNRQSLTFSKKILTIVDNLDEVLNIASEKNIKKNHIIQGITLTLKSLLNNFVKFNIKIEDKNNIIFQPHLHESIATIESKNIPSNHVISVLQRGYILNNKILRKAKVEVSR